MRSKSITAAIITLWLILPAWMLSSEDSTLKLLYDQHRWFELRDAIHAGHAAPLYEGAVAAAFNDTKAAEKYLNRVIKLQPDSTAAEDAHEILANVDVRKGKYREAVQQLDQALRIDPNNADAVNARALFAAWSKYPDQSTAAVKPATIHAEVSRDGVKLPLVIHGKTVHWALDTGANFSLISESEARMLGVAIDESSAMVADSAGGRTKMRTAVVDELAIGDARLRNVAFLVLPDSQEPMSDLQPGERGLIGLPIVIALQSIAWSSDGSFQIRPPSSIRNPDENLSFDGLYAVTRADFEGKELDCIVDSGDQSGSQFWTRFARDFDALVKQQGVKSSQKVTMVGGSNVRETITLPEMRFRVGGLSTTLQPAPIFSKPVGDDFHHCLLGLDVLSQAKEVRMDFRSMMLQLLP